MRVGIVTATIIIATSVQLLLALPLKSQLIDKVEVNIALNNETLIQAFQKIEARTPFRFMYREEEVKHVGKLNLRSGKKSVAALLQTILSGTSLTYRQVNDQVLIMPGRVPAAAGGKNGNRESVEPGDSRWLSSDGLPRWDAMPDGGSRDNRLNADTSRTITGIVKDKTGNALVNVSVMVAGTRRGTATNSNGEFSIPANKTDSLVFSSVGFATQTVPVGNNHVFYINLDAQEGALNDVVVVGFGTQKRESVIGAITTIDPERLQSNQTRGLSNALVGQIAGIIGVKRSGEPGYDASDIWIRGINTFGVNSTPLVIVDGVERSMDNLSPEEIASFSVLKDATATAVYGVRGANGAIVIKTKRGSVGKPRVGFNADFGVSSPIRLPEYLDGASQMEIINEARKLSGGADFFSQNVIDSTRKGLDPDLYPSVNWLDQVTNKYATNSRINMDINGGTDRLRYRFIVGMFDEKGIIKTDPNVSYDTQLKLQRYNVRSNIDMDLTSSTLFSVSIGGYLMNRNAPGTSAPTILDWSMQTPPIVHPAVYSTGEFPKNVNRANPWVQATQTGYQKEYQNSIQSVVSMEQNFGKLWKGLNGLTAKVLFSFDAFNWHNIQRTKQPNFYMATGRDADGNLIFNLVSKGQEFLNYSKSAGGNRNMYFEFPVSYNRTFKEHSVSGLLLYNRKDFVNVDATSAIMSFPYRNEGLAGRFTYDYDKRYFGEFNFGYNGSENFEKGYRYGFFPSFALGWMVSNEAFMSEVTAIDRLKIRGSWGKVGNDKISNDRRFGYVTTIESATGYKWGWTKQQEYAGVQEGDFGIPNLTWETATKSDIGLDIGLFNGLNIQLDVFKELRTNIFMLRKTIPETAGYISTPYANYGKVENKGFDASVEYNKRIGNDLTVSFMGNITYAKNKIIEYDEPAGLIGTNRSKTGYNINQNFGLIADGLYTNDDFSNPATGVLKPGIPQPLFGKVMPGDIKYYDVNGDGKVGADDEVPIGKPTIPETVYGLGFSVKYKKFDVGLLFQGITNVDFIISGNEMIPGSGDGSIGNILSNANDRWTPEDPRQDPFYPRLSRTKNENNNRASTWWLKNGSFMRLKYVELGYTVFSKKAPRQPFNNARIYLRGSDLFTFSPFKLWDPELIGTGYRSYPSSKIMSLGFSVNL